MANQEARAMLDALMGVERDAALPTGAAVPRKRKNGAADNSALLLPGKRQKSCFDKDIDPLYTAWGVDVFDLFVNTKSDLGTNPYVVDEAAHQEFQRLSQEERDRTGYYYFLFQKLQELVRQCDRTVARNKDKLQQELKRKLSQRGGQDFVEDVDEATVESLVRAMWQAQDLMDEWKASVDKLDRVTSQEELAMKKLEPLLEARKQQEQKEAGSETADGVAPNGDGDNPVVKTETEDTGSTTVRDKVAVKEDVTVEKEATVKGEIATKEEEESHVKQGEQSDATNKTELNNEQTDSSEQPKDSKLGNLQMELGKLTLEKQRLVFEVSRIMSRLVPLQESIDGQHRTLNYVKSDISTDKTVCEVSGNFMSSRDADERIAAHYAGKQYVGWKLVRDKFQEMIQKFGRYGPPPPPRETLSAQQHQPPPRSGGYGRGSNSRQGGGSGRYPDRGRHNDGGGGYRGGDRGRWERHGPSGGGGYQNRGRMGPPRNDWRR